MTAIAQLNQSSVVKRIATVNPATGEVLLNPSALKNADAMWRYVEANCWYAYSELTTERKNRAKKLISFRHGLDGESASCEICDDKRTLLLKHLWTYNKDGNKKNNSLDNLGTCHPACHPGWKLSIIREVQKK